MEEKYENLLKSVIEKLTADESYELANIVGCPSKEIKNDFSMALMKKSYEKRKEEEIKTRLGLSKKELIGLKLKDLKEKFPSLEIRVLQINDESFCGTSDHDLTRLNVVLENVKVLNSKVEKIYGHEFIINEYGYEDEGLIKDCDFG